MPFKDI